MDAHKNFAYSTVATAPSPALSGTSLVVETGTGTRFPTVPFNAVVWPTGESPLPTNAEVVRVTNISSNTLTITRAQESSTARTILSGDQIAAAITAKVITDIEDAVVLTPITLTYAATLSPNCDDGLCRSVTMTGDALLNIPSSATAGRVWRGLFTASGGSRELTLASGFKTLTGSTYDATIASGSVRVVEGYYTGSAWLVIKNQEFAL